MHLILLSFCLAIVSGLFIIESPAGGEFIELNSVFLIRINCYGNIIDNFSIHLNDTTLVEGIRASGIMDFEATANLYDSKGYLNIIANGKGQDEQRVRVNIYINPPSTSDPVLNANLQYINQQQFIGIDINTIWQASNSNSGINTDYNGKRNNLIPLPTGKKPSRQGV
jgi:hypothetical protein